MLVIAGPGSGKTFSLVLRAVNLFLLGRCKPAELVLCTFTEKAAYELRDRITATARKVHCREDLSGLRVGTIHSICNRIIAQHRHRTALGSGYETLDDLGQLLFLFDHFDGVCGQDATPPYLGRWQTKWGAIEGLRDYFNKITEELVDPERLAADTNPFLQQLGRAYTNYRDTLFRNNRVDFAHQQSIVHDLLLDAQFLSRIGSAVRYVLVDEYQDTNYVQQQLLLKPASATGNMCVVGDVQRQENGPADGDFRVYRLHPETLRRAAADGPAASPWQERQSAGACGRGGCAGDD